MSRSRTLLSLLALIGLAAAGVAPTYGTTPAELEQAFRSPPSDAIPWTFWYWMNGRVSPEGITADLEAMKRAGLGGAYLMPIKGPESPPEFSPLATQLSPRFWQMVRHAAKEADRLGLQLGIHACDGFAVAGGPWITPELSMQHLVWNQTQFSGGKEIRIHVAKPQHNNDYYRDVALLAFPTPPGAMTASDELSPLVTTSDGDPDANRLSVPGNTQRYRSDKPCWIQFEFDEPFTCRSVTITPDENNYQSQRMSVSMSNDGKKFEPLKQFTPPRHGWQDEATPVTHAIPATTARFFRFTWTPEGSEPGAEDLDSAKWSPVLKVQSIVPHSSATIPSFRGKSSTQWRVSEWADSSTIPEEDCVSLDVIIDLSNNLTDDDTLVCSVPPGKWTLLRIGHTTTGKTNATGGGGQGLECDKFNPAAVRLQFDNWFGEFQRQIAEEIGEVASARVLTTFHVDSWECGSQNWTPEFAEQFRRLRGYDPRRFLPCIAGVPVESAETSERFLRDLRSTVADLTSEAFYGTLRDLTHEQGLRFTAECTAPTMTGDAMRHFLLVDSPMGEFWLNSPTHDKPNDMHDAVSAAHIYGKPVVQAEAFTQLRIRWDETPHELKALGDRQLALGANRMVMHVFTHNPWLDRKPGQTLGGVGLYFQRDQPWLPASRGWMQYYARCGSVLQQGRPVADIAVWTGDDMPSRSLTPERLIGSLPGLIGEKALGREQERLENQGQPMREKPSGVRASANIFGLGEWTNPLQGYQYDSINSDALLRLATVENGRIVLPGGASYGLLVLPARSPLMPEAHRITPEVAERLADLVEQGAIVLCCEPLDHSPSLSDKDSTARIDAAVGRLKAHPDRFLTGARVEPTLESIDIAPDLIIESVSPDDPKAIAWNHRSGDGWDVYFLSNQVDEEIEAALSLRNTGTRGELWDPVTGAIQPISVGGRANDRRKLLVSLEPSQSVLLVMRDDLPAAREEPTDRLSTQTQISGPWRLTFESAIGNGPSSHDIEILEDLSQSNDDEVRHFAGVTVYETTFSWTPEGDKPVWLTLEKVAPLAEVEINGVDCGVVWTAPWKVQVTDSLRSGENRLVVRVPSTWKNRLTADAKLPEKDRRTWTTAPVRLPDNNLTPFGLMGTVQLLSE